MVKMLDVDRHGDCPLWEALASNEVPWTGVRYACLNVLHAYCKVFDKKEIYDLIVRKTCQSCKCPREAHAIYQQQTTNVHERLGFKVVSPAESGVEPRDLGYTWVPPGIRMSSRINRYFEQLPMEKVPKVGSEGARYREQQISYQLPKQDLSLEHCKHLEELHEASYEDFVTARNEIALDIGYVKDAPYDEHCAHCDGEINVGEMVVAAPKFVESVMWHPRCFTCNTCNELLVDLTYCVHEDKIYCERHYAELLKPRCAGCDELQGSMRQQLANAEKKEALAGTQVMKDGVPYKDGFRLEDQQSLIDHLKEQLKNKELSDLRRQELEKELAKQTKIAEKLRKELAEAEAKYQHQLMQEEEAKAKKLKEEQRQREEEERAKKEAEQQALRLVEAEKRKRAEEEERIRKETEQKDNERKIREEQERIEAEEHALKLEEAERKREAEQREREEAEENARRLQALEKERENEQRMLEEREREKKMQEEARKQQKIAEEEAIAREMAIEEKYAAEEAAAELAAKKMLAIEHQLEEQLRAAEKETELNEKERLLISSIKGRDLNEDEVTEHSEAELLRKILKAREQLGEESEEEQSLRLVQRERDQEAKQKRIEENALLFLEAEKEMAELQSKMLDAVEKRTFRSSLDSAPQTPIVEEPCIKRSFSPLSGGESTHSTVKTQLAQDLDEPYSVRTKPLLFPGVSDDASSVDPASSQKSSFSTQPSEEITTGTDSQYPPQERQEPDGEDNNLIHQQYTDDYLRSLDGIKQRPLVREDGSGRRRAFKKRRSSNSSNSSRESRQSRDEELKMFTSLEEEEMKDTADSEYMPIRYSTDPTLKVKGHHRRHKRSPAKDMRREDDSLRSSLERLGEETSDPWGEVRPEHYKHTEFWKREKTLSIDEETELEKPTSSEEMAYNTATNLPSASSFEEATQKQNQEALSALQKHSAQRSAQGSNSAEPASTQEESAPSGNTNLQTSINTEKEATSGQSSVSPRLRLSPRKEEANKSDSYSAQTTPIINVQTPLDYGPWRDEYGLMMEGLSDFYDFTASVNPSRSRSASRNVSPANTAPNTPLPKNVSFQLKFAKEKVHEKTTVEIYDDAGQYVTNEFKKENIIKFLDSLSGKEVHEENENEDNKTIETETETETEISRYLKSVADDPSSSSNAATLVPLVNIVVDSATGESASLDINEASDASMNTLVSSLRSQQSHRSRSRSKSPLPTADNLKRSVENRRYKMIKHNEDILEKLIESKLLPELTPPEEEEDKSYQQNKNQRTETQMADSEMSPPEEATPLEQSLQVDKRRSRSKSPMRLPTPENLSKGLEKRRSKLIERNDELIKQLEERSQTPESSILVMEPIFNVESSEGITTFEQTEKTLFHTEEDNCTKEEMDLLVQSLRIERSKTRSKSPFVVQEVENTNEVKTYYGFRNAEYNETTQYLDSSIVPNITIDCSEAEVRTEMDEEEECSRENMDLLVQSLRAVRSKSASRSPMRLTDSTLMQGMTERAKTPEPTVVGVIEISGERSRHSRSMSPSPSYSPSPELEQEFFQLANHQRQLDEEALEKLRNASEEIELRTLAPPVSAEDDFKEQQSRDHLSDLPLKERAKLLKKSPTTPDYERTVSEEVRDNERIKQEMLKKGFKRSTYVGESMDLGSEFDPLRKEAASFQRSRSPSPSISLIANATAQRNAEENRKIQDLVLQELATSATGEIKEYKSTGAIPKTERFSSCEIEISPIDGVKGTKDSFERLSTFTDSSAANFEEMRRRNAEFRRSASASRSPLRDAQKEQLAGIEEEAAKRVLKDKILDEVPFKFQDISRGLNTDFFKNDRRASDSALIKTPGILVQLKDDDDMEPEEYLHYRRFSLAQEEPQEQYPGDDYICIQEVEVTTRSGSRTWLREDFYSDDVEDSLKQPKTWPRSSAEREKVETFANKEQQGGENRSEEAAAVDEDEDYSNASDDDRQTVVEVDDEIDEDISDFNERGPAEESHHEISECEEAEREVDRYAGREASDWNRVVDVEDRGHQRINFEEDEGAVGGFSNSPYDSDSFAIDQIYDEAIKNRKQSGILREYDNILRQMSSGSEVDEQYLLWSKTNAKKTPKNIEFNTQFLENERKESEMRYLGDANTTARQSARLHSRYGYKPILQVKCLEDDLQVDLNYKPKREYNWRKNFKLDDEAIREDREISLNEFYSQKEKYEIEQKWQEKNDNEQKDQLVMHQLNLRDESAALFSHSPVRNMSLAEESFPEDRDLQNETSTKEETKEEKQGICEKPKKKKTKKKSHKETKASLEETMNREDEEAYDNQVYSRRSSSIQMETDSPKRKSRSRRSSKSSLTNEDSLGLFSPRSSVACNENIGDIMEEFSEAVKATTRPKKMKKRKKVKETMANVVESPIESREEIQFSLEVLNDIPPVSAVITPESTSANILSALSPQNSVCITPASIESDLNLSTEELRGTATSSSTTTTDSSPSDNLSRTSSIATTTLGDSFDILKDANFYPLF